MPSLKPRIKLTNECSNGCWYCYSDKCDNTVMTEDMFDQILERIMSLFWKGKFNRIKFGLTGGDPYSTDMVIKATEKIQKVFKKIPHFITGDVCQQADNSRIVSFLKNGGICLLSLNEDPIENVIEKAKIIGKRVYCFNVVLTDFNMNRIDSIIDASIKYKLPIRIDHLFNPDVNLNFTERTKDCINYMFPRIIEAGHNYNLYSIIFGNIHARSPISESYCGYGRDHYYINVEGFVRRCQMTEIIGHILEDDIDEKIKLPTSLPNNCSKECDVFSLCKGGCPVTNAKGVYCATLKSACLHLKEIFTDNFYKQEMFKWRL